MNTGSVPKSSVMRTLHASDRPSNPTMPLPGETSDHADCQFS